MGGLPGVLHFTLMAEDLGMLPETVQREHWSPTKVFITF